MKIYRRNAHNKVHQQRGYRRRNEKRKRIIPRLLDAIVVRCLLILLYYNYFSLILLSLHEIIVVCLFSTSSRYTLCMVAFENKDSLYQPLSVFCHRFSNFRL